MISDGLVARRRNEGSSMGELLTLALHNSPSGTETQKLCFACESSDVDPFGLSGNGLHLLLTSARQRAQLTRMLHDRVLKFRKKRADLGDGFGKTNRKNVIGTILGRIANVFGFLPSRSKPLYAYYCIPQSSCEWFFPKHCCQIQLFTSCT